MTNALIEKTEEQGMVEEIKQLTTTTKMRVDSIAVVDEGSFGEAVAFGREVKSRAASIEERIDKILKPLNEARNSLLELKRTSLAPFVEWEKKIKSLCVSYMDDQERKREEERKRKEAEAMKKAEDERLRHAQAVEETQGSAVATTLLEQPITPLPLPKEAPIPKAEGASFRVVWKYEITNPYLVPREFLTIDEKKLSSYATSMKETAVVAGVRFYSEKLMGLRK